MKKKIITVILVIALVFSIVGCGKDNEASDTETSDVYIYTSEGEMKSDVEGEYIKSYDFTQGEVSNTMTITSTTVTTIMTFADGDSFKTEYEISEWIPGAGLIVLDDDSIEDNKMSVTKDGKVFFGAAVYEKDESELSEDQIVDTLTDAYAAYVLPEDEWEYFMQEEQIPIPTSCINCLQEYISEAGVYTYIVEDGDDVNLHDIVIAYNTILMKDCGLTLESIDSGLFSVSKNSNVLAICGEAYDSDADTNYLVVTVSDGDSETEDDPEVDITEPIDSSKLISDEDLEADFAEAQARASLIGEDLQNIWDAYDIYKDEDYGGNYGCLYEKAEFWNLSGDFKIQYRKSDNSVDNVYFSWEASETDVGYIVDCLRRIYGDDYTVTDLSSSNRDRPYYEFRWEGIESSEHFPQFIYKFDGAESTARICFCTEYRGPSVSTEENADSSESATEKTESSSSGGDMVTGGRRRPQS